MQLSEMSHKKNVQQVRFTAMIGVLNIYEQTQQTNLSIDHRNPVLWLFAL